METEKSVPFGLLIRCKRICSEEKYFEEESKIIIQKLISRKYPNKLLQEALDKVKKMDKFYNYSGRAQKRNPTRSDYSHIIIPAIPNSTKFYMITKEYY